MQGFEGARRYGGRWNPVGVPRVYASESQALAALEIRVHIDKTCMRQRYSALAFRFPAKLADSLPEKDLPNNWRFEPPSPVLQDLGKQWAQSRSSLVLIVPSVVIPHEKNYLINPLHPDFAQITFDPPKDFAFDVRVFR